MCLLTPLFQQTSIKKMETAKVRGMAQLKRQGLREQTFVAKHEAIGKVSAAYLEKCMITFKVAKPAHNLPFHPFQPFFFFLSKCYSVIRFV